VRRILITVGVMLAGAVCLAQAQSSSKQRIKAFATLPDCVWFVGI
jgi:hypothetical protein